MAGMDYLHRFHSQKELLSYRSTLRSLRHGTYTVDELWEDLDDRIYVATLQGGRIQDDTVYVEDNHVEEILDELEQQTEERTRYERWCEKDLEKQNRFYRRGYQRMGGLPSTVSELKQLEQDIEEDVVGYGVSGHTVGVIGAVGLCIAAAATGVNELAVGAVGTFGAGVGGGAVKAIEHSGRKYRVTEALDDAVHDRYEQRPSKHEFLAEQIMDRAGDHTVVSLDTSDISPAIFPGTPILE